jgi:hypothetical protein
VPGPASFWRRTPTLSPGRSWLCRAALLPASPVGGRSRGRGGWEKREEEATETRMLRSRRRRNRRPVIGLAKRILPGSASSLSLDWPTCTRGVRSLQATADHPVPLLRPTSSQSNYPCCISPCDLQVHAKAPSTLFFDVHPSATHNIIMIATMWQLRMGGLGYANVGNW